ncbi:MAG: metal ABC transporter permease [Alphaproteobacteria bacterium]|jgi:zinc/manganese transport system permease protein|nr:metal ABC transporter permease [Alphaproteobacteria bacterium]
MSALYTAVIQPFVDYGFMSKALLGCLLLSLSSAPLGVLLMLRQMSLMGDAMAHAVLPGVAVGFILGGASLPLMSLGGFTAGIIIAVLVGLATRSTILKEDANLAAFYLMALSLGVLLISLKGNTVDLMHLLFGSVLAVDTAALLLMGGVSTFTLLAFALFYRGLLAEAFDPVFLRSVCKGAGLFHLLFLILVVVNLVASFQALGTLMAVGLMMLPAVAARFWTQGFAGMVFTAASIAICASTAGLLISYYINVPTGPAIILSAGSLYILSMLFGRFGSIRARYFPFKHLNQ